MLILGKKENGVPKGTVCSGAFAEAAAVPRRIKGGKIVFGGGHFEEEA